MPEGPLGGPRPFAKKKTLPSELEFNFEVNKQRVAELKQTLSKYKTLEVTGFTDASISELIILTYKLDKPVTLVEIDEEFVDYREEFIDDMKNFFFVYDDGFGIYISRFKTPIQVIEDIDELHPNSGALSDEVADLSGIFFGFDTHNIAGYIEELGIDNKLLHK